MRELIQQIFKAYGFGEKWQDDSIEFYAAESEDKTSFFLIDYIEATCEGMESFKGDKRRFEEYTEVIF